MSDINRREFIKNCGVGAGAIMTSNLWLGQLFAGERFETGEKLLSNKFGIGVEEIQKLLQAALYKGGEFSELFFEYRISNSVTMEEEIIKSSSESISLGVGVRVLNGRQTGYGYTNDLTFEKIKQAALTAGAIASTNSKVKIAGLTMKKPDKQVYNMNNPISKLTLTPKINLVKEAYTAAASYDSRIVKVNASFADELQYVVIANSEGLMSFDIRPQSRLICSATAKDKGISNTGSANAGGRVGMNFYLNEKTPKEIGEKASKEAIILLSAKNAPSGEQTVVLSKDQSGVMIHEAVGHPLEADGNWKKTSIMWDKMNKEVANPIVSIYDDATIPEYRGSLNIDDEGTATKSVPLIEKGKLVGFMNDRIGAKVLGHKMNGHGRRQSYRHPPIPRMNNTVLKRGDHAPEEIISSVKKGIYAVSYQGGMVSGSGKFTFSVNMGYLIENGKLTQPLKNATLIGTNVQILKEVEMIGSDMGFFLGTCGKAGQNVPVTCGTPTLKIRKMTVGGAA